MKCWSPPGGETWRRLDRRGFLRLAAGAAAVPVAAEAAGARARASRERLEQAARASLPDEEFWEKVRREFLLDPHVAYMNNGTLGPTPRPVLYSVIERYQQLAVQTGLANTEQQGPLAEDVRAKAAAFVGANPEEVALTRNTTEGMSLIANGLDLKAGDEVLMTFHEHPGGLEPWRIQAKRRGVVLKEVRFPLPCPDPDVILNMFDAAITPRTRIISVSHTTYQTGTMMPVRMLVRLARAKGILTLVDGAHPLGQIPLDMHDLGVDYYAMSPHKWLDAPSGTGLLYLRREAQDRIWPAIGSTGWDDPKRGAARFDRLSQRAWPLVISVGVAMDFQNAIGRERIEQRVRALHARLRERVAALPNVKILTSGHAGLSCALLGFSWDHLNNKALVDTLLARHGIYIRTIDYGLNAVRVSTHYYNTEEQVDRLGDALQEVLKNGVMSPALAGQAASRYAGDEYEG